MWRRRAWKFYLGFPPPSFYFHGASPFPSKKEYLEMLQEYRIDLAEELKEVDKEIEGLKENP